MSVPWPREDFEELFEQAPVAYLSTLPDGLIILVNQTLVDWTGYKREELVGERTLGDLFTVGGRIYLETHYAPLLAMQDEVREIALDVVCADGRRIPVLASSTLKRDPEGRPLVVRTTLMEASDRREYERELLRARLRAEESELRARVLAETLQESLIPPDLADVPGLDVGAVYRAAGLGDEVGGDFYDLFETTDGDWAVVLGDVEGKGADAATVTALARYTARAAAMRAHRPRTVLGSVNQALLAQDSGRFCTALYARLRVGAASCRVTMSSAGHPLPLLVPADEEPRPIGRYGTLAGVFEQVDLHDAVVELSSGDALVLYTDGLPEARRGQEFLGDQRVLDLLRESRGLPAQEVATSLVERALAFQSGLSRDDMAVLVLRVP